MSDFVSSGTTTTKTSSDIEIDGVPMPGLKLNGLTVTKEKIWSKNMLIFQKKTVWPAAVVSKRVQGRLSL